MSSSSNTCTDVPPSTSEQLCYIYCNFCNIVLAVSVPSRSLFDTVTVRCGNCSNMWAVNLGMTAAFHNTLNGSTSSLQDSSSSHHQQGLNQMVPNYSMNLGLSSDSSNMMPLTMALRPPSDHVTIAQDQINNRHLEKRQRVPSLYNRFIKEEIQRIKASNPEISHKEAFSTAAKNWAHFPRIQFGPRFENHHKANLDQNEGSHNPPDGKA